MMDGTFSRAMKNALIAADAHGAQQCERDGDAVGQAQPIRQRILRDVDALAEIHGEDAGHRDHAADRHVEVARDQQERDADADDHDVPVVRQEVDDVLGLVEVRHESDRRAKETTRTPTMNRVMNDSLLIRLPTWSSRCFVSMLMLPFQASHRFRRHP